MHYGKNMTIINMITISMCTVWTTLLNTTIYTQCIKILLLTTEERHGICTFCKH